MSAPRRRPVSQPIPVHQLKITLMRIRPPIWRRIVVPSDATLSDLHDFVQAAMGWYDCHLHEFQVDGMSVGNPLMLEGMCDYDESQVRLAEVAPLPKRRFRYLYDFGDSWDHDILVEAVMSPEQGVRYPICVAGRRACPPEDCGGHWGYAELLESLADPQSPVGRERREWIGGSFDAEAFDVERANARLQNWSRGSTGSPLG